MTEFLTTMSALELASIYARYYVQDFAEDVLNHVQGSIPSPNEETKQYIEKLVNEQFNNTPIVLRNKDVIGQFLIECAQYALAQEFDDPDSRAIWDRVKMLPSVYHNELKEIVFNSASYYEKMFKGVLTNVLGQDAYIALETIASIAKTRIANEETGGTLHYFNWGILNNGVWLNGALAKAFSLASIFSPEDPVVAYYAIAAFDFAKMKAELKPLDTDEQMHEAAELNLLMSHVSEEELETLDVSEEELRTLLFDLGNLRYQLDCWALGINDIKYVFQYLPKMSALARALLLLLDSVRIVEEQELIGDNLRNRLNQTYDAVTLALVGYEALRETRYKESFLLAVNPQESDMLVDVFVNEDLINAFRAAGGEDSNLIYFGNYFDPRKGFIIPTQGWSLSFIINRQVEIVSEMMAQTQDRLEELRSNDAAFIEKEAVKVLTDLVKSITTAANKEFTPDLYQAVLLLARTLSNSKEGNNPFYELLTLLTKATGDNSLMKMAECLNHCQDQACAVAMMSVSDAISYISDEAVEE